MNPNNSIIIPFFNAAETLEGCLTALSDQIDSDTEILCVDDGSTEDYSKIKSQFPNVKWLRQDNRGPAAARNFGVRSSKGQFILFTDSDCIPSSTWVKDMTECLKPPSISGVKGAYKTRQREITARFVQIEYEEKYQYMKGQIYIDFIDTYSAGYKREVFDTDFFDEGFTNASVEDQEFSFRLCKKGHLFKFCPNAFVFHKHASSPLKYSRKKFKNGFWKTRILKKMGAQWKGDSNTPLTQKTQMLASPLLFIEFIGSFWPMAHLIFLAGFFVFLISNLPLLRISWKHDFKIFPFVLFFTFLRSVCLDLGLIMGFLTSKTIKGNAGE